jgi:diguanylate cyclase (GGDEF)-like protein
LKGAKAIDKAKETSGLLGIIYMDLDRFKFINDTLGHAYGDLLLKQVSTRLEKSSGSGNMVARVGGDEFILLITDLELARRYWLINLSYHIVTLSTLYTIHQ